jgi:hypothetical protein
MSEIDKVARYYFFIKWFKANYKAYYLLYGLHIVVPDDDLIIKVQMDYVAPEDKQKISDIIEDFNLGAYD